VSSEISTQIETTKLRKMTKKWR